MSFVERVGVRVGDVVAFSRQYLQQTDTLSPEAWEAQGTVKSITQNNGSPAIATVDWHLVNLPSQIIAAGLTRVTERGIIEP